jgi:hypothetical protein
MRSVKAYAFVRIAFGAAALMAPKATGGAIAGDVDGTDANAPLAKAFIRGMGGREIGLGLGVLDAIRTGRSVRPWLLVGVLADTLDTAALGLATWQHSTASKRVLVLGPPVVAAIAAGALAERCRA